MTIQELRAKLQDIKDNGGDEESDHVEADRLLIKYINDDEVKNIYNSIEKWYA